MRFDYKLSSELTAQEVDDIVRVFNLSLGATDAVAFQWKYRENPYGDSLHMIAYDDSHDGESQCMGSMNFWRDDLGGATPAYQCVNLGMIPSHQGHGIFGETLPGCVERLNDAFLYTFPNSSSQPGFERRGWITHRKMPISIHRPAEVLREYSKRGPIR